MRASILLAALIIATSCAPQENRYLTLEEDARVRERCAPYDEYGGCVYIPVPLFMQIMNALQSRGMRI